MSGSSSVPYNSIPPIQTGPFAAMGAGLQQHRN